MAALARLVVKGRTHKLPNSSVVSIKVAAVVSPAGEPLGAESLDDIFATFFDGQMHGEVPWQGPRGATDKFEEVPLVWAKLGESFLDIVVGSRGGGVCLHVPRAGCL